MEDIKIPELIRQWLDENCNGKWKAQYKNFGLFLDFSFENEEDALAFKLRWW